MNPLRPQFSRDDYISLDGIWNFTVMDAKGNTLSDAADGGGSIRVPYPPEAPLSGVGKHFPEGSKLWYSRKFTAPSLPEKGRLLLHVDGVDQKARIFLNGKDLGTVCTVLNGPASLDVTDLLQPENTLILCVTDDLRDLRFPYGKQTMERGGMWYTPVSGIWQSVWLEPVPENYIRELKIIPSLDSVHIRIDGPKEGVIRCGGTDYPFKNSRITLRPEAPRHWTPDDPYLYRFSVITAQDKVDSYFALRKVEVRGSRILLNGRPFFFHGLLDQGYWPGGLWTPPEEDSFEKDILAVKRLGFNTLRKHIKAEPERFYYDCDRLGMIVFQDMINNGHYSFARDTVLPTLGFQKWPAALRRRNTPVRRAFLHAMRSTVRRLYNHPCVCYWTIFNEGWGQFRSSQTYKTLRELDSTRVIDTTSGWFRDGDTDVESRHVYFRKFRLPKKAKKPVILSEFGGYVFKIPEHSFDPDKTYGYRFYKSRESWMAALEKLYQKQIIPAVRKGLCGAIYTQVSDVEDECNGLLTYDRALCKADEARMQAIAKQLKGE
ncbi:MAG: glycoside hydrolase family 2 [Lachnospiraceae bacterium]|nr:glycoside hydrolase family 2 [Lachnospiraceae bacterium]